MPLNRLIAWAALATFLLSLSLPAFECSSKSLVGYEVLVMGWAGLLGLDPRWLANIGLAVLLVRTMLGKPIKLWITITTGLLAVASLAPAAGCPAPGGAPAMSSGLASGGYLWVGAILLASLGAFVGRKVDNA